MPIHTYSEKPKIYSCIQYDGTNYDEIAAFAPMMQEGGKVYLIAPVGNVEIKVSDWIMLDIWELYSAMADVYFQKGYKPGGGPAPVEQT